MIVTPNSPLGRSITIAADELNQMVIIEMDKKVERVVVPPDTARHIAEALIRKANSIDGGKHGIVIAG